MVENDLTKVIELKEDVAAEGCKDLPTFNAEIKSIEKAIESFDFFTMKT